MAMNYDQGYDWVGGGNVYNGSYDSVGLLATAEPAPQMPIAGSGGPVSAGTQNMITANPIHGLFIFGALVLGIMFAVEHGVGEEGNFSNPKLSFYSVLTTAGIAAVGIPAIRAAFTQLAQMKVPLTAPVASYLNGA